MNDAEIEALENRLKPRLTPEFLATLLECHKVCGNIEISGRCVAGRRITADFVEWAYSLVDDEATPDTTIYDEEI